MTAPRPMAEYDLADRSSYQAPPLEADLIMKGGITSGVVYPLVASRLATRYRFRSVGGASAGAIAAGLTAAAEYQRQHPRPDSAGAGTDAGDGFVVLTKIPDALGTTLSSLFVPASAVKRAYQALTAWIEPEWGLGRKLWTTVTLVVAGAPWMFLGVTLAALVPGLLVALGLLGWPSVGGEWTKALGSLLVWLPGALLLGLIAAAVRLLLTTMQKLPDNGYGFCNGLADTASTQEDPPLTEWLTRWLDEVAGLEPGQGPLTFGHLYGEAASTAFRELKLDEAAAPASPLERRGFEPDIDLQMMTTCLSFQRPYVFPFRTRIFHYCPECWKRYFPERVLNALNAASALPSVKTQKVDGVSLPIDQTCAHHPGTPVRMLPAAPDVPVVVGVRLSLSFPVLLSGIPFQAVDFNRAEGKRGLVELWFSDGGICSNFPIHFFDTLLPRRPTFGINLADEHPDFPDQLVFRPGSNRSGIVPRARPIASVVGFLGAVWNTASTWVDALAVPAPGFRDRVVDVRTRGGEGGLNLKMTPETITALSERGDDAALLLEEFDFDNHRWVRYRTAMSALTEVLDRMSAAYPQYEQFIAERTGGSYQFDSAAARAADREATEALMATVADWAAAGYPATDGSLPDPRPQIRPVMRQ